jgi:hypothetical protein
MKTNELVDGRLELDAINPFGLIVESSSTLGNPEHLSAFDLNRVIQIERRLL